MGVLACFIVSRIDYRHYFQWSPFFLLFCIVLLLAVFIPGLGLRAYGAHRWLNARLFVIQPSELTKLAVVIYLSAWFSVKDRERLVSFLILLGTIVGLVIFQPDMGTAIVLGLVGLTMFFLSDISVWKFCLLLAGGLPIGALLALSSPYRLKRVLTFLNPESDPLGSSYHIRQILIALGSGGLSGLGLGNCRQQYSYLPESTTDSIFAIIGEELGLVGVVGLLVIFVSLIFLGIKLAQEETDDTFGQLLIIGIISWIGIQTLVNIGSMLALIPLTGVPLPFISYGGSALVVQWVGVGIIFSVIKISRSQMKFSTAKFKKI